MRIFQFSTWNISSHKQDVPKVRSSFERMDQNLLNEALHWNKDRFCEELCPYEIANFRGVINFCFILSNHHSMTIHAIMTFRGSSEWPLSDVSDEQIYTFIQHILMELCHFEKVIFPSWGNSFMFFMRNMTSEKSWEVIMTTHYS